MHPTAGPQIARAGVTIGTSAGARAHDAPGITLGPATSGRPASPRAQPKVDLRGASPRVDEADAAMTGTELAPLLEPPVETVFWFPPEAEHASAVHNAIPVKPVRRSLATRVA